MSGTSKLFVSVSRSPLSVILLPFIFGIYLLLVGQPLLAIAFTSYSAVLIQLRINLGLYIHGYPGAGIIRRILRLAVYFLPLPFVGVPVLNGAIWAIPAGVAWGLALQLVQLPQLRFMLSKDFIAILPSISREDKFLDVVHPVAGAIAQEYLYRGIILFFLQQRIGLWSIAVVVVLFAFEHLLHFNALQIFDNYDLAMHIILSIGLGLILYFSHSLVGCMLGHITYNSPSFIQALLRTSQK